MTVTLTTSLSVFPSYYPCIVAIDVSETIFWMKMRREGQESLMGTPKSLIQKVTVKPSLGEVG